MALYIQDETLMKLGQSFLVHYIILFPVICGVNIFFGIQGSVLMTSSTIEPKDEIEEKLEKADKLLTKVLEENKDSHDLIINHATKNPQVQPIS